MKTTKKQADAISGLSKRALKMLGRIEAGKFYDWTPYPTGAMKELADAGLVGGMGRVVSMKRCFVTVGSRSFKLDKIRKFETGSNPKELG